MFCVIISVMNKIIIGISGNIGSGKGAASEYLQSKYNFKPMSFADPLKDVVSSIFSWPKELLQGKTEDSRKWREEVDVYWSKKLNIPNLTPRYVLQKIGTELFRDQFHSDIWEASLEKRINDITGNIVIDDCRFSNEFKMLRNKNSILIRINRGKNPVWYNTAIMDLKYKTNNMKKLYPPVHISEWGWILEKFDYTIANDGSKKELYHVLDNIMEKINEENN